MKVRTETINGREFDIILEDSGKFSAKLDAENTVRSETLEGLLKILKSKSRRAAAKLNIPVLKAEGGGFGYGENRLTPVTLTGLHGGTENIMFLNGRGKSEQARGWGDEFYKAETDVKEFARLVKADNDASAALAEFQRRHKIDAKKVVEAELAKLGIERETK